MAKGGKKSKSFFSGIIRIFLWLLLISVICGGIWGFFWRNDLGISYRQKAFGYTVELFQKFFKSGKTTGEQTNQNNDNSGKPEQGPIVKSISSSKTDETSPHLLFGIPGPADTIIRRDGYALGFSNYHKQPIWVSYHLTNKHFRVKQVTRQNDFREDPEIKGGSATLADYRASGYDRGHMAPAADMAFSVKTMSESFYMSNMSPQAPECNRGIWKEVEEQVREFARTEKNIYIVTGPILPETKTITIGPNHVTVPKYHYKVIYDRTPPEKMIGFIVPNTGNNLKAKDFAITVREVEERTGLNFFNQLPHEEQDKLETELDLNAWKWLK